MLDLGHLPPSFARSAQFFYATDGVAWVPYTLPLNKSFVFINLWCAGGGGGAGESNVAGTTRGGGAAGGAGGMSNLLIPRMLLPDTIYVQVGAGGLGGTATAGAGNPGANGGQSYVCVQPNSSQPYVILTACQSPFGNGGASGVGGASQTTPVVLTATAMPYATLGIWASIVGSVGGGGGSGVAGGSVNQLSGHPCGGGAGGGGTSSSNVGANATGINANLPYLLTYVLDGMNGFFINRNGLILGSGACGGKGSATQGSKGGDGGLASGGGGGGAGTTGGAGGNGGNGLVMIGAF